MIASKIFFGLFIALLSGLGAAQPIFCQTEKIGVIQFTPPPGWTKTPKDGVMVYSNSDKSTGGFCLLTVYPSTASAGNPNNDFANEWNEKVVKPFKAQLNPKTETQTEDGWTSVSAASQIESDGIRSAVMMTVISGYGRTASILALFNNQEYLPQIDAFLTGIMMDKAQAIADAKPSPTVKTAVGSSSDAVVGKWGKSFSGTKGRDQSANVLNSEYYKSQYTFNSDGTYIFKAEKWLGYLKSNEFWMTDESGNYTVVREMLTIIPKKSVTSLKNREGVLLKTEANPLEKTTYKWSLYYFAGLKETNLILQTDTETRRDGPFGSNDRFPKSYFFSQKYVPEWRF
jgi:hypothetical protein